jgi:hypothetical protein
MSQADDRPRFLGRAGTDYTRAWHRSIDPSAECVDVETQQRLTSEAHRRWRRELQREWGEARSSILDGVERFKSTGRLDRKLANDLRLVERGVAALDRDVLDDLTCGKRSGALRTRLERVQQLVVVPACEQIVVIPAQLREQIVADDALDNARRGERPVLRVLVLQDPRSQLPRRRASFGSTSAAAPLPTPV